MKKKLISCFCIMAIVGSLMGTSCGVEPSVSGGSTAIEQEPAKWFMSKTAEYTESEKGVPLPVYTHYYDQLGGPDVMPIGTYSGPPRDFLTDERFLEFQEVGFNFFTSSFGTTDWASTQKIFELSDKYGFGIFADNNSIGGRAQTSTITAEKIDERVQNYLGYDSFLGVFLVDEPTGKLCEEYKNTLTAWRESKYASNYDMYYNALPDYAAATSLSGTEEHYTYEQYMRKYIEELDADYFSYDYYPFGFNEAISDGYFGNLAVVRNVCQEYEIPFWVFGQCGFDFGWKVGINAPNEGQFIWGINTALAYGAKGVQYFVLNQPSLFVNQEDEWGATRAGMYGIYGNKNEWWYYAKKANTFIKNVDHVLMNSAHMGVIFHGNSPIKKTDVIETITEERFRQMTSVQGDDALVGCFDYYGGTALLVVNNNVKKKDAKITLTFDDIYGYEVYQRDTVTDIAGNALQLRLDKGEAALVVLK